MRFIYQKTQRMLRITAISFNPYNILDIKDIQSDSFSFKDRIKAGPPRYFGYAHFEKTVFTFHSGLTSALPVQPLH